MNYQLEGCAAVYRALEHRRRRHHDDLDGITADNNDNNDDEEDESQLVLKWFPPSDPSRTEGINTLKCDERELEIEMEEPSEYWKLSKEEREAKKWRSRGRYVVFTMNEIRNMKKREEETIKGNGLKRDKEGEDRMNVCLSVCVCVL